VIIFYAIWGYTVRVILLKENKLFKKKMWLQFQCHFNVEMR